MCSQEERSLYLQQLRQQEERLRRLEGLEEQKRRQDEAHAKMVS